MSDIYRGNGWGRTPIGVYENGCIYRGNGWGRTPIGEYNGDSAGGAAAALLLLNIW